MKGRNNNVKLKFYNSKYEVSYQLVESLLSQDYQTIIRKFAKIFALVGRINCLAAD